VHECKPIDCPERIRFCNWILKNVHDGLIVSRLLFITDKACFQSSSYVNSQNARIWSDKNPHAVHQILLCDIKIGVRCAINARRIVSPIFYCETVNLDQCIRNILEQFFNSRLMMKDSVATFKQDNTTVHTA
jgi:hypothetical protein